MIDETTAAAAQFVPVQNRLDTDVGVYHSIQQTERCKAICKHGSRAQCLMGTAQTWPYCRLHLQLLCGLDVQPSQHVSRITGDGLGLGLFATRVFERGDFVSYYSGDIVNWSEISRRYPNTEPQCPYLFELEGDVCIDARSTASHPARYINDYRNVRPTVAENCLFENLEVTRSKASRGCCISRFAIERQMIVVRAVCTVVPGEEFFAHYGNGYVFDCNKTKGGPSCPSQRLDATSTDDEEEGNQGQDDSSRSTIDPDFVPSLSTSNDSFDFLSDHTEEEQHDQDDNESEEDDEGTEESDDNEEDDNVEEETESDDEYVQPESSSSSSCSRDDDLMDVDDDRF